MDAKDRQLSPADFAEVVKRTPLVSIDLIVLNGNDEVLLGFRSNEPAADSWFVPGGRIAKDERISQAFGRITENELGVALKCEDAQFAGVFEHLYPTNFTRKGNFGTHYVVLAYKIKIDEDILNLPTDQHSQYKWVSGEAAKNEKNIHPNTMAYFEGYI
ncbi:MAG: GDP-mannose mannosyl hydrolase [Planctomycetes bacterium]|nr:GDP-mannose mannosyl hydrolase [Planctomycetota bacterium]